MTTFKMIAIAAVLTAGLSTAVEAAQSNAIVALFSGTNSLTEQAASDLGCAIYRSGSIIGQQGPLQVDGPTGFAVLTCDQPILVNPDARASLNGAMAVFEGDLSLFPTASNEEGLKERQYILKLGYYKNDDINGRLGDLVAINAAAKEREGHWINEAFLNVDDAIGMVTPDEVVMIHYASAKEGTDFRNANQDILQMAGLFNKTHLTGFTYLFGTADK